MGAVNSVGGLGFGASRKQKTYKGYKLDSIKKYTSTKKFKNAKMRATFSKRVKNRRGGYTTHRKGVFFGQRGASDFTKHRDPAKKAAYIKRHRKNEDWKNPMARGTLSRYILWNKPTLEESIRDYKKRFFTSK